MKHLISALLILIATFSFAQEEKLQALYKSRDFEKCYKKANSIIEKDVKSTYAYYYKAITLFEMEQLPSKYKHITEKPLELCLKSLVKLTKYDEDQEYANEHADTLKIIKDYAEGVADDLIDSYKAKSIRIYKSLLKAFPQEYSALRIVEIHFMADDFGGGFRSIEQLYANAPADVSPSTKSQKYYEALLEAPLLLVKYSMFNNAYYIIESYKEKFANNAGITGAFKKTVFASLTKLAPALDKELFFTYTDRSMQIYGEDAEFKKFLFNLFLDALDEKEKKFASIENPSSWKDSVILRDFFMHSIISYSIFPVADLKDKDEEVTQKYRLKPDISPNSTFSKMASEVLQEMRYNECVCNTGVFPGQDSLAYSIDLTLMAQEHARDMFAFNYTDTLDRDKKSTIDRIANTGLKPYKYNTFEGVVFYGAVKATESAVYTTPISSATTEDEYRKVLQTVFNRWKTNKLGDCEKIMTPEYTHYGFAAFGDRYSLVLAKVLDLKD